MPLTVALLSIAALLGAGGLAIALARNVEATRIIYGLCFGFSLILFVAAVVPRSAAALTAALPLGLPWIGAHFRMDVLSAFFLAIVNLGGAAVSLYAIGYGAHEKHPSRILPFFPAFLAGMNLVLLADDAFSFLVAWEFMSLSSWALVMAHHHDAENRRAGFIYLLMASFGTLALLMAFGLLAGSVGGYSFSDIRDAAHGPSWKSGLVLALVLLGAGSKAGLVPLHIWLPLAHPAAPSHVSALMSGVMTKVAIYGFIRIVFDLLGPPEFWWSMPPLTLGAITAMLGILSATIQSDLKKLLAYSTIENIGIIFVALGLALAFKANGMALPAALAFTAALFHVFNHSLFKSLLFLGAGAVLNATGERDIERLGGLIHSMPRTAFVFLGACLAISALPPLNGFVSEWLVFQAVLLSPSLPQWSSKTPGSRRRRRPGAERGAVRGMLCSRIRRRLSGARAINRGQECARDGSVVALGDVRSIGLMSAGGSFSELYDRYDHAGREAVRRRPCADPRRHSLDVDRADRREPQLLQWPAGVCLHHLLGLGRRVECSPIRLESPATRPRVGLRLSRPEPRDPIYRQQFRSADPPDPWECRVCRARPSGYAAARRYSSRAVRH